MRYLSAVYRRVYILHRGLQWWARRLLVLLRNPDCHIAPGTKIGANVQIDVTDSGRLRIDRGVSIGAGTQIIVRSGEVCIGANTHIGPGCVIAARECITLGSDCLLGEYVVVRDQNHAVDSGDPIRLAGFDSSPISVGENVWLGSKSSVLAGSDIGAGSVVGAHALVRGTVPPNVVAAGVPARVIRRRR